ncbi:hypothetical protein KC218_23585, partial [Mycobacterium tuberculosis]|nr:hypothetical protein [Mycobacterium tuberculosis]
SMIWGSNQYFGPGNGPSTGRQRAPVPMQNQTATTLELGARGQDVQFDYLHATRYRGETTGGDLVWKHKPATSLFGRRVLLIDDILDEGYT